MWITTSRVLVDGSSEVLGVAGPVLIDGPWPGGTWMHAFISGLADHNWVKDHESNAGADRQPSSIIRLEGDASSACTFLAADQGHIPVGPTRGTVLPNCCQHFTGQL